MPLPGRSEGARAVIAVPLMSSDTVVGVLMFTSSQPGSFTSDHLRFLRTIGTEVSAALHNAELYKLVLDSADRLSAALMQQKEEAGKREAILRSVSEGVMVLDQSGTIILYNPAAERVLQVPADQVIGQTLQIFARYQGDSESEGGADRALLIYTGLQEGLRAVDSNDQVYSSTISLGGQTINASFAPVTSADGSRLGVVVVLRDITREIEADRAKRDFISMVSHELRTPLTPIRGYVDLMLLGAVGEITDTQRDCLNAIKKNMLRMLSLVEDLLEIGRIEAGKIKLDITLLDIASSINEIVGMLKPMIDSKEMNLTIEIPPDLPQIEADSKRIGQVLTNMISNAIKYTFARGNIWVRAFTRDDDFVQIEVQDTGVGIKPEDMKKLFTRFFRTDNPLRDEAGGTGLGLSIAKSFVEMHGGEMWVESELNVGSTFKVALPIRQPRPELDAPQDP
ncbi:MAG: hypothetical protein KatS3mg057_3204 [Herpetosiphonaceae bacterium]|nr:MAG: hypothetical protein KatS3mg057_3204 [Herpetosiphonaceae bacterium]